VRRKFPFNFIRRSKKGKVNTLLCEIDFVLGYNKYNLTLIVENKPLGYTFKPTSKDSFCRDKGLFINRVKEMPVNEAFTEELFYSQVKREEKVSFDVIYEVDSVLAKIINNTHAHKTQHLI
jgi:hypothetical protein